jgi:hypothetical protein
VVLTAVLAGANLPTRNRGASAASRSVAAVRDIDRQLAEVPLDGPVLVDVPPGFETVGPAVLASLQRRGISFVVDDEGLLRQLGPHRRFDGRNPRARLWVRAGRSALDQAPPGARLAAVHRGLADAEEAELRRLRERIRHLVEGGGGLRLTESGRQELRGSASLLEQFSAERRDGRRLLESDLLVNLHELGLLEPDPVPPSLIERYGELRQQWDARTVAVFVDAA